jgi:hypothetical protein
MPTVIVEQLELEEALQGVPVGFVIDTLKSLCALRSLLPSRLSSLL